MNTNNYDVIVMGGGPAGSSVAGMLAREGRQVILFEKEIFPRHHIGESLMTDTYWTFRRLGLLEKLKESPFVRKYSVQFANSGGQRIAAVLFLRSRASRERRDVAGDARAVRSPADRSRCRAGRRCASGRAGQAGAV